MFDRSDVAVTLSTDHDMVGARNEIFDIFDIFVNRIWVDTWWQ